jgi:hypothetical protein
MCRLGIAILFVIGIGTPAHATDWASLRIDVTTEKAFLASQVVWVLGRSRRVRGGGW